MPDMKALPAIALIALALHVPADAQRRRDQDEAYQAQRNGAIMPLREIEARVIAHMQGATYLGPEFDPGSATYRLKFMRGGQVIWIDVDARTGREISRSGK
ncbi:PepSY domain-containing protein [Sphingomonas quercus]|uniref:PepSY domain-containing protein n=1 Tax=Sphingomonas quercus TaxID=2842451 RepID=A0ABS6BJY5_9SPHN|nr:PepSY domain-containing protein [Sphingomonas quercus]MBU3078177.1 PepSY domain-containing protein [Sphingomonas quercus]